MHGLRVFLGLGDDLVDSLASQHGPTGAFDEVTGHLRPPVCDDTETVLQKVW